MNDVRDQPVPFDYSCTSIADFLTGRRDLSPHQSFAFPRLQYFPSTDDDSSFYPITLRDKTGEISARVDYSQKGIDGENLVDKLRRINGGEEIILPIILDNFCSDTHHDPKDAGFYLVLFTLNRPPSGKGARKGFRETLVEWLKERVVVPKFI